jgi:hypothetical protein
LHKMKKGGDEGITGQKLGETTRITFGKKK